jgi:hypothetical protein
MRLTYDPRYNIVEFLTQKDRLQVKEGCLCKLKQPAGCILTFIASMSPKIKVSLQNAVLIVTT